MNIEATLESGQIFRWEKEQGGAWVTHNDKHFFIDWQGKVNGVSQEWADRFFRQDQPEIKHNHPYVAQAISRTKGLRVIRQDPWECLITFIISQNNNQKRIQQNCKAIAQAFGKKMESGGYRFPKPQELGTEEEMRELKLGYRAGHIAQLKEIDLDWLYGLSNKDYETAKKEIMTLRGVGPKVADCILLFSMEFLQACPEDVWIKRVFSENKITKEELGEHAGIIQQALFHYARESK